VKEHPYLSLAREAFASSTESHSSERIFHHFSQEEASKEKKALGAHGDAMVKAELSYEEMRQISSEIRDAYQELMKTGKTS